MSMDQPRRPTRTPGGPLPRPPRSASPAVAVVVALLAAVLGFVVLKSLDDDDTVTTGGGDDTEQTDESATETTLDPALTTTATTLPAVDKTSFKVLVANASQVKGSAGNLTEQLASLGYQMLEATNAVDTTTVLSTTVVYHLTGGEAAGAAVAATIGRTAAVMPAVLPVSQASFDGGTVLVMLGTDLANQAIPGATVTPAATGDAGSSPNDTTTTVG